MQNKIMKKLKIQINKLIIIKRKLMNFKIILKKKKNNKKSLKNKLKLKNRLSCKKTSTYQIYKKKKIKIKKIYLKFSKKKVNMKLK